MSSSAIPISSPSPPSSPTSSASGSPPTLDPSTLALLNSFIASKTDEERRFNELAEEAASRVAGLDLSFSDEEAKDDGGSPMMSVDEYRAAFSEDWQLSQFWYTTPFAMRFARLLHTLCTPSTSIAFLCCPTAFVAFEHVKPLRNARLLEVDGRFSVLTRKYVPYDMEEPTTLPTYLTGAVDIAVVDPPFLNEYTNTHVVTTLRQILCPSAKTIVLTSTSVTAILEKLYDSPPLGPLRMTKVEVQHGQLRNDFGCWASWEGSEELELLEEEQEVEEEKKD
ncbi:putative N6-adenine methyltransferase-domain-containing protein [Roridomyces roridus]|uniref:N6-adenine methyltransferase-domain-containing protein n=1 Tax=Roridomyces roridus TaxID=1738132 RepID=A0AAD7FKY1_9AGAR|nr:putative N6-adenine methyltransferase-domain-containing protein [Roridomyces roridus]